MIKEEKIKNLQALKKLGLKAADQLKGMVCYKIKE